MFDEKIYEKANSDFARARKANLMGRYDEARQIATETIMMLDTGEPCYSSTISSLYEFLGDSLKAREYLGRDITHLKEGRRRSRPFEEAMYGTRYLDAHIESLERKHSGYRSDSWMPPMRIGDKPKLVVFDLDGTLLEMEDYVWSLIEKELGISDEETKPIEKRYRNGRISYDEWADEVLAIYKERGLEREHLEKIAESISPVPGARETLEHLKGEGKRLVLISGSLDFFADAFFPEAFDYMQINKVFFEGGKLSHWSTTPYGDGEGKSDGLLALVNQTRLWRYEPIYVGDNENDVQVMREAGLGIAVNPKTERIEKVADVIVRGDLRQILDYIG